jgi:SAM-dependent methyltransferase
MAGWLSRSSERVDPARANTVEERITYLEHRFAYDFAARTIPPGGTILDVGCGTGYGAGLMAESGHAVTGIDVSEEAIAAARSAHGTPACRFEQYDGRRIPFPDGHFVAVTAFQVIEHVRDDQGFARELARVLDPAGVAILTTPDRTRRLGPGQKPWNIYHVREYAAEDLRAVLEGAFAHVTIDAVCVSPAADAIEAARIRRARRVASLDPLQLRRFLPRPLLQVAANALSGKHKQAPNGASAGFSLSDFSVCAEGSPTALDLLAICRR